MKGSGNTMASVSSAPRATSLSSSSSSNNSYQKAIKAIDKTGFTSDGMGQWELDTPYGGAQILDETDTAGAVFGYKEYGVSVWDKDYNMIENGQTRNAPRFNSLNEAKRYAKELIKDSYK